MRPGHADASGVHRQELRGVITPSWLAVIVGYGAVFLAVVIPLSFLSFRFSQGVKKSPVSALDRALGAAFGVVRGLAVIGIDYLIFSAIIPIPEQRGWMLIPDQHLGSYGREREQTPAKPVVLHRESPHPA